MNAEKIIVEKENYLLTFRNFAEIATVKFQTSNNQMPMPFVVLTNSYAYN